MTFEGLGEMFEGDSADMCAGKFPQVFMGGRAEGLACADPGARTPIGASGDFTNYFNSKVKEFQWCQLLLTFQSFQKVTFYTKTNNTESNIPLTKTLTFKKHLVCISNLIQISTFCKE